MFFIVDAMLRSKGLNKQRTWMHSIQMKLWTLLLPLVLKVLQNPLGKKDRTKHSRTEPHMIFFR